MRFGVREICNVVLRAKATQYLGSKKFYKDEPVLYFDTLKTSTLEGASTTVYATGGRGNVRLVAWEGERTVTFTMEDALISPESFSILSGAGLIGVSEDEPIYVHTTYQYEVKEPNTIILPEEACWNKYDINDPYWHGSADIFVMTMTNGQIDAEPCIPYAVADDHKTLTCYSHAGTIDKGDVVLVDYYVKRTGGAQTIRITADKFGGNYYLEASTLFRDESTGVDMPAEFIIPNCKVQSNFTFSMASSGDPSTFTFTMDAFPDYTKFNKTEKVFADIQVITEAVEDLEDSRQACVLFSAESIEGSGVTLTYDNDGDTRGLIKITATGAGVLGREADKNYEKAVFGDLSDIGDFVQAIVHFNDLDNTKQYTVTQSNPALKIAYPTDFTNSVKTKDYSGAELSDGYAFLIGNVPGLITITIIDKGTNKVLQTVQVINKIAFKKSSKVTINDDESLIDSTKTALNGVVNNNIDRVYEDDVICLTLTDDAKVTAVGANVEEDSVAINTWIITAKAVDNIVINVVAK